jgi:hypothetical protein
MSRLTRWLTAVWPVVRSRLPAPPARVVEICCGSIGGFVPMLGASGYEAYVSTRKRQKEATIVELGSSRSSHSRTSMLSSPQRRRGLLTEAAGPNSIE